MAIRVLPPEVASKIAAGEVVERPASVVKELLENALDAGAKHISIHVEAAGKRLIEVSDDGAGILPSELPLAVSRYATSKLSSAADLFRITTLGFRGEALASIAAVSRLTLVSRPAESEMGAKITVEGGQVGPIEMLGTPLGTVVRVENLFYNVPARMKFLKSDLTERRLIEELVSRYALAYPHVRIHLFINGALSLQTSGNGAAREVLAALYGLQIARQMFEVLAEEEGLSLNGFISPLSITRSNRREITFFVNGRWIQDTALTAALLQAYHTLLMVGRYPLAILFLRLPPETVDVNVHPTKAEVRFRDRDRLFSGVQRAVRRALMAYSPVAELKTWQNQHPSSLRASSAWQVESIDNRQHWTPVPAASETEPTAKPLIQAVLPSQSAPLLRPIGQVAAAYLVAEGPDGLYLIDQHAAHERILYERFMAQRRAQIPVQVLLEPTLVELPSASAHLFHEQLPMLASLGFQVEPFGSNAFLVRGVPAIFTEIDPAATLSALVEDFEEDETPLGGESEARLIARICKRAAVKAGQVLSMEEQKALLQDLEACQSPRTCPHGRPTMIHLSVDLLERQFGRKGPHS
mgnify:CR=1 FL=1